MTHSQIKHAVSLSLMWSMSRELSNNFKGYKSVFKTLVCAGALKSVLDITLKECDKVRSIMNTVEEIKISVWKDLATVHYADKEDVEVSIPTIIEDIFYSNFDWMSKIKNLQRNVEIISMNMIDETANARETRLAVDRYDEILSKHIYRYLKELKGAA